MSQNQLVDEHAVEFLRREITNSPDPITVFGLGPLTNIATLIRKYPEVSSNIEEIVIMGGAVGAGNVTPTSEFNIRQDPEAADIVFSADIPILLYTWDVFVKVAFDRSEIELLMESDNQRTSLCGQLLLSMLDRFGDLDNSHNVLLNNKTSIGDAGAVACILNPDAITVKELPIAVELNGKYTRGQTVIDQRSPEMAALEEGGLEVPIFNKVRVVIDLDVDSIKQTFVNNLEKK
jgi:pyrimidine-specific ribonucleoside hydrolase